MCIKLMDCKVKVIISLTYFTYTKFLLDRSVVMIFLHDGRFSSQARDEVGSAHK